MLTTNYTGVLITQNEAKNFIYFIFCWGKVDGYGELNSETFKDAEKELKEKLNEEELYVPKKVFCDTEGIYTNRIDDMITEEKIWNGKIDFGSFNYGNHPGDDDFVEDYEHTPDDVEYFFNDPHKVRHAEDYFD